MNLLALFSSKQGAKAEEVGARKPLATTYWGKIAKLLINKE
jgi:hypothetical protein